MKSVFVTFYKSLETEHAVHKDWLSFMHPMGATYNKDRELEVQLQLGAMLYPQYPIRSLSESFAQLKKSVGILGSNFHSVSVSPMQYHYDHFVVGIDTEKAIGASWTGISTRAGDLLSVRVKSTGSMSATDMPSQVHIVLHSENMLEITNAGVSVYD